MMEADGKPRFIRHNMLRSFSEAGRMDKSTGSPSQVVTIMHLQAAKVTLF
jgi:hypothetical protein